MANASLHTRHYSHNNSLIHFVVIETLVSHFNENYGHFFAQGLEWHWLEDFITGVDLIAISTLQR